jgi:putative phage-type endonuclease
MKKVNLEQGTPEWLEFRRHHIGSSDAPIIMGVSKFCTRDELILEKRGIKSNKPANDYILNKGHKMESKARHLFELELGSAIEPAVIESEKYPFLAASLDGLLDNNVIWEHKLVGKADFETVKSGKCLDKYFPQLQHQLLVTGLDKAILAVSIENDQKEYEYAYTVVKKDDDYISLKLLPALYLFWTDLHHAGYEPAKKELIDYSHNQELGELLKEYEILKTQEKRLKAVTESIFKIAKTSGTFGDIKLSRTISASKKVVDYERLVTELNINTDSFMIEKPGIETKRITFKKEKTDD